LSKGLKNIWAYPDSIKNATFDDLLRYERCKGGRAL